MNLPLKREAALGGGFLASLSRQQDAAKCQRTLPLSWMGTDAGDGAGGSHFAIPIWLDGGSLERFEFSFFPPAHPVLIGSHQYVEFCNRCGVRAISLYVFSVENFKRSDEEVGTIIDIVVSGLDDLVQLADDLDTSIRLCGQRELVSPLVLERLDEAAERTKHNKTCASFPYTSFHV